MLQTVMRLLLGVICAISLPGCSALASEIVGAPSTKQECLIVPKARLVFPPVGKSPEFEIKMSEANTGHQIAEGTSTVFVFRRYEDSGKGPDSGTFTKLTLVLKSDGIHLSDGQTKRYDASDGFFITGNDGFVANGGYSRATNAIAPITVTRESGKLNASLQKMFIAEDGRSSKKKEVGLSFTCTVRMASVKELDSWEGKVGTDWESFAPAQ